MVTNLYKALSIKERYDALNNNTIVEYNNQSMVYWRSNMTIIDNSQFDEMLFYNGFDETIFSEAVNYKVDEELKSLYISQLNKLEWYQFYIKVLDSVNEHEYKIKNELHTICQDFLDYAYNIVTNYLKSINFKFSFSIDEVADNLINQLENTLSIYTSRATILDINLKRDEGLLDGDNSENRFSDYIEQAQSVKFKVNFFEKYPVLARNLSITTIYFINNIKTVLNHLNDDIEKLRNHFKNKLEVLEVIEFGEGDTHSFGKSVCKLKFQDQTLIYKPKNLEINKSFDEFITRFNQYSNNHKIKNPDYLLIHDHCYESFVEYLPCHNTDDLADYYYNFGKLLSVVYYLNGTDMHMENLIASGKDPVLVDLETLIQQPMIPSRESGSNGDLFTLYFEKVTRTLMLPDETRYLIAQGQDLSALDGRHTPDALKGIKVINEGTDIIRYEESIFDMPGSQNIPYLSNNDTIDYNEYTNEIIEGFEHGARLLKSMANKFNEHFSFFDNVLTRVVLRNTSQYDTILKNLQHPDMLSEMLDQEKIYENLWSHPFPNKDLIRSECDQLRNLDIPIFFNNTDSKNVTDPFNNNFVDFFNYKPYEYLKKSINNFSDEDIKKQIDISTIHFSGFQHDKKSELENRTINKEEIINDISISKEVEYIADSIISTSDYIDGVHLWFAPSNIRDDKWSTNIISDDLYNGKSGVFLFFYYLSNYNKDSKYIDFYNNLVNEIDEVQNVSASSNLGLSSELGYFHAISLINDFGEHKVTFRKYIRHIANNIDDIDKFTNAKIDFINGYLPVINSLVRYYEKFGDISYLGTAFKYFDKLLYDMKTYEAKDGYGHGIYCIKNTYNIIFKYLGKEDKDKFEQRLHDIGAVKYTEMPKWCNGYLGKYALNPIKYKKEIEEVLLQPNDTLCHGNMGTLDLLVSSESEMTMDFISNIISTKNKYGTYKLMDTPKIKNVSLYSGLSGIGYELLRVINDDSMPSLLDF